MVLLLLVALSVGGCSRGDSGSDADPETTTTRGAEPGAEQAAATTAEVSTTLEVTTTTEARTPEEEVEAAYLEAMAVFYAVVRDPEAESEALLAEYFGGPSLLKITESVQQMAAANQRVEFVGGQEPVPLVTSVTVDSDLGTVLACLVDDAVVVAEDGSVVDDDVVTANLALTLQQTRDTWRVTQQAVIIQQEGRRSCG